MENLHKLDCNVNWSSGVCLKDCRHEILSPKEIFFLPPVLPGSKTSPVTGSAEGEQESGAACGRKRRWGSSTAVTTKKPSISITTDSLKVLVAW